MDEATFWVLVELAARDRAAFQHALDALSNEDLEELVAEYGAHRRALLDPGLVALPEPPVPMKDLGPVADWVVARGQAHFSRIFDGREALPARIPEPAPPPTPAKIANDTFHRRIGRWVPNRAPDSDAIELDEDGYRALVAHAARGQAALRTALAALRSEDLIYVHGMSLALASRRLDADVADALIDEAAHVFAARFGEDIPLMSRRMERTSRGG